MKDIEWLGKSIDEAINHDAKSDYFKHRRDGYKALHVIRRSNHFGQFLELSEFHSGSRQGVLCIPEGKAKQGWVQFATLCKGFWDRAEPAKGVDGVREHRRVDYGNRVSKKGKEVCVPRISPMEVENHPENPVIVAVNIGMGDLESGQVEGQSNSDGEARVQLLLELSFVRGPDGKWAVSQAHLAKPNPPKPASHTSSHTGSRVDQLGVLKNPNGPTQPLKQIWKPKLKSVVNTSPNPKVMGDPTLESSIPSGSSSTPTKQATPEVIVTSPEPIETGESIDAWARLLREGTRLFVPPMPPLPLAPNPFYALSETSRLGVLGSKATEAWGDGDEESTDLVAGGVLGEEETWEAETLWVEPLAVSYPAMEENVGRMPQGVVPGVQVMALEAPTAIKGTQSDWVMDQMKEFGLILGASFEGFEDKIMELLINIEASSGTGSNGAVSPARKGVKSHVPRELRNLISGVTYAEGSSRRNSATSGRALMLSQ